MLKFNIIPHSIIQNIGEGREPSEHVRAGGKTLREGFSRNPDRFFPISIFIPLPTHDLEILVWSTMVF